MMEELKEIELTLSIRFRKNQIHFEIDITICFILFGVFGSSSDINCLVCNKWNAFKKKSTN